MKTKTKLNITSVLTDYLAEQNVNLSTLLYKDFVGNNSEVLTLFSIMLKYNTSEMELINYIYSDKTGLVLNFKENDNYIVYKNKNK